MRNNRPRPPKRPPASDAPVRLAVRVQPKASRNHTQLDPDGRVRVSVTAPPTDGAANEAVRALLAARLDLPKSAVQIVHGQRGRDKHVSITGISLESVLERLRT